MGKHYEAWWHRKDGYHIYWPDVQMTASIATLNSWAFQQSAECIKEQLWAIREGLADEPKI